MRTSGQSLPWLPVDSNLVATAMSTSVVLVGWDESACMMTCLFEGNCSTEHAHTVIGCGEQEQAHLVIQLVRPSYTCHGCYWYIESIEI